MTLPEATALRSTGLPPGPDVGLANAGGPPSEDPGRVPAGDVLSEGAAEVLGGEATGVSALSSFPSACASEDDCNWAANHIL